MVIAAFVCVVAVLIWVSRFDIQENRYATYVEAREALDHGWLPTGLPRSATLIHEWHDLDTNRRFGSFRFDPGERSTLEPTLRRGVPAAVRIDRDPSFATTVPRDPGEAELKNRGFEFYSDGDFALAINWDNGTAYFWNSR
jgi:hypothetical protein